ncbi:hypothetical protein [Bacillus suaedae]|uniref:Uncharacterized protein n=1 Tax=Halalkalibacter suaedae TaxID=2822140 RepID=A0A941ANN6_9BACI|nr:hypothetical protein [Bacillus suaedae]MBP3951835.1 hypothetical protein [Bacillus suaedae]
MLILSSGITGFLPAPSVDEKEFKQICYSLFGSKVLNYIEYRTAENFYECVVQIGDREVHVLLNGQYPLMAFTSKRELDVYYFPFINEPELSKMFEPYYEILNLDQLSEPLNYIKRGNKISMENDNSLHQDELKQIIFWQPRSVGEVVFNYWD